MGRKRPDIYYGCSRSMEKAIVDSIDFSREFDDEIKLARKIRSSKNFATDRKKQLELKRLGMAIDLKMLFQQMETAIARNDAMTYNSLALVFHEKYGKYLAAHEQGVVMIGAHGVVVLPEQKKDGKKKKTQAQDNETPGETSGK